jgi:hypothetical protein
MTVLQTFEQAIPGAFVDHMKRMGGQPVGHRSFIPFPCRLIDVNHAHDLGATDLQRLSNGDPVSPSSTLSCHGLLAAADNLGR